MAHTLCFTPSCSLISSYRPGIVTGNGISQKAFQTNETCQNSKVRNFQSLKIKAADNNQGTKSKSIVCSDCDGNGAVLCTQCKGSGVNSVDHFNGQFKAGALCWLCRGRKDILCGTCNGAGFLGGFMSSFDD